MWRFLFLSTALRVPFAIDSGTSEQEASNRKARASHSIWSWSKDDADARLAEILRNRQNGISSRQLADGTMPMSFSDLAEPTVLRTDEALHQFLGGLKFTVPKELYPENGVYDGIPGFVCALEELNISKPDAQHISSKLDGSILSVRLEGLSARADGEISWSGSGPGWTGISYKGQNIKFTSEIVDTTFEFTTHVDRDPDEDIPHNIRVTDCKFEPTFDYKSFQVSHLPKWISAERVVTKILSVALRHFACPIIEDFVSKKAKWALDLAVAEIEKEYTPPRHKDDKYVNMRAVPLLQFVDEFVQHDLGADGLNKVTQILYASLNKSKHRNTPLSISHELVHPLTDEKIATISLSFKSVDVKGLDKVQTLHIPNLADSRDTVSVGTKVKMDGVKTSFKVNLKVVPFEEFGSYPVEAFSDMETEVGDIEYMIQIAVMLLKSHLPAWNKQTAICPECLLPAIRNVSFADFNARFALRSFRISPIGAQNGSLEADIDQLVNNGATLVGKEFRAFSAALVSKVAITRVALIVNDVIRMILEKVQELYMTSEQLQSLKNGHVPALEEKCKDHGPSIITQHARNLFYCSMGTVAAVFFLVWQIWLPTVKDRSVVSGNPEVLPWHCLAGEPQVPKMLVLTMPFLLFSTICLQLWATCTDTGVVGATVERANTKILFPPVHALSAQKNVRLMLDGHMYVLAVFTFWTCSVLPFIKLGGLMFAWLAPRKILSVRLRGFLMGGIDAFGKWNFIDFFIMSLLMAALHIYVTIGKSSVVVKVRALEAFFYCLYVAVVTQWFSYLCFVCHQKGVEREAFESAARGNSQEAATSEDADPEQVQRRQQKIHYSYVRVPRFVRVALRKRLNLNKESVLYVVPVLLVLASVLFVLGLNMEVISVEHHGLAGELVDQRKIGYTVLEIAQYIPHFNSDDPDGIFIRSFQFLFLFLVVGAEGISLVVLSVAYFVPIHGSFRHTFTTFARTVQAWACLDVFAFALIGFSYYMPFIQDTLKGDKLDIPNYILEEFLPDIGDEPVVFRMDAVLLPGTWLLLISSLISRPVVILCRWAMHDVSVDTSSAGNSGLPSRANTPLPSAANSFSIRESDCSQTELGAHLNSGLSDSLRSGTSLQEVRTFDPEASERSSEVID